MRLYAQKAAHDGARGRSRGGSAAEENRLRLARRKTRTSAPRLYARAPLAARGRATQIAVQRASRSEPTHPNSDPMNTLTPFRSLFPTTGDNLFSRLDAPMDRLWRRFLQMESLNNDSFSPAANVIEKADSYVVKVELPGIPRDSIHVTLQDNILTIRGEKKEEKTSDTDACRCQEVSYGTFERSMSLPNAAEQDVDAQLHAGVLTITVKKRKEARAKEIPVKGA